MSKNDPNIADIGSASGAAKYCYFDLETTGVSPRHAKVITGAFVITDCDHNILGSTHQKCHTTQDRIIKNSQGWEIDTWPKEAQDVHGISYQDSLDFQHPIDFCRNVFRFIRQFNKRLTMVYHANAAFDVRFLFSHFSLWTETGYFELQKYLLRDDAINTMAMLREYNKRGKMQLTEAAKIEKQIAKFDGYLTRPRKTPAKPEKLAEWTEKRNEWQDKLNNLSSHSGSLEFNGVGLAEVARVMDIKLDHHDALSDTMALIPLHKYLREHL